MCVSGPLTIGVPSPPSCWLPALHHIHIPRDNHGVQTMYEFAEDCGSMERSRYFGFSKGETHNICERCC